jgi:acetyl esterase/lipase
MPSNGAAGSPSCHGVVAAVQAALIVDVLRAHQLLMDGPSFTGLVDKVVFMGHSLGGACSIIAAAKVQVRH